MSPDSAADLAARTVRAIDAADAHRTDEHHAADRERVASDLAGLQDCWTQDYVTGFVARQADRFAAGLLRTAALYGVTP